MHLIEEMRAEAAKLTDRATGWRIAGEHDLCDDLRRAADGLLVAVNKLEIARAGEREAKERAEEMIDWSKPIQGMAGESATVTMFPDDQPRAFAGCYDVKIGNERRTVDKDGKSASDGGAQVVCNVREDYPAWAYGAAYERLGDDHHDANKMIIALAGWIAANEAAPVDPDVTNTVSTSKADDVIHLDRWAVDRMLDLRDEMPGETRARRLELAFVRYIMSKEKPPVDPDLIEAREVVCQNHHDKHPESPWHAGQSEQVRAGHCDHLLEVIQALAGIKRGRALERGE